MSALNDDKPQYEQLGICQDCVHRLTPLTCNAFPERIPDVILTGEFDHHRPYPGDGGVQFEAK